MGGVIPIGWTDAASSLQLIRSDAIEPLAISGMKRVLFHFGCALTRRTARWARPRRTSLHRSDQLMHIPPDRRRGNFWRWGEGTPEMESGKNKKARNLAVSGPPCERA